MNSFLSCYRYLQNLKIVVTFCFLAVGQGPDRRLEKLNFTDIVLANFDNNLFNFHVLKAKLIELVCIKSEDSDETTDQVWSQSISL